MVWEATSWNFKTNLTDRKQKVVLNNTESKIGCLYAGVPQGSDLGPILFLIYNNDIADHTDGLQTCRTWLILTSQTLKSGVKTG
jgi:hypothetical protein